MALPKFDFKKPEKGKKEEKKESPMGEMKEHEEGKEEMDEPGKFAEKSGGKKSAEEAGLVPVDASCSDCSSFNSQTGECSKVDLPQSSDFDPYSYRCSMFSMMKDGGESPDKMMGGMEEKKKKETPNVEMAEEEDESES